MRLKYFFSILLSIGMLWGCGGDDTSDQQIFRYNQASGITSLDPAFAKDQANIWATNQLFDGLVELDDSLHIQPAIASRWKVSDDGRTYTFYLRDDVYFHDHEVFEEGKERKVTASDFVYSFNRLLDPNVASPGGWVFRGRIDSTNPFVAVNDSVLKIHLAKSFPPFLGILTMQYCSVLPEEAVEYYGKDFRKNPVGAGPFRFKEWQEGEALVMVRNEQYYEKKNGQQLPYLDAVKVTFQQDKQVEFLRFKQGELHLLSGIDGKYKDQVVTKDGELQKQYEGQFKMLKAPYLNTEYLGFMMEAQGDKPIINKKIRKAINYGFDRKRMIRYLRNNIGIPARHGFVPPVLLGEEHLVEGYHHDPEKSTQLLKEAGYPGGEGLPTITLYTNQSYVDLTTFVKRQLEDIGIDIEMNVVRPSQLREWMAQGKVNFFRGSWIADYPDAESYLTVFYGNNPAPPNYTRFNNARYDSLYRLAMQETALKKRKKYYRAMEQILVEQAPVVPLYYDQAVRFIQNEVKGLKVNAMNLLDLTEVRFRQSKKKPAS